MNWAVWAAVARMLFENVACEVVRVTKQFSRGLGATSSCPAASVPADESSRYVATSAGQRAARDSTFRRLMRHPRSSRRSMSSYTAVPLVPSAMTASPFERARTPSPSWPRTMMLVT